MRKTLLAALLACGVLTVAAVAGVAGVAANTSTGPSSSQSPYVLASQDGVVTKSILTVGDSIDGYKLVGIPDGLGALKGKQGTFTVLMNHELRPGTGGVRAHGANAAFVSQWAIRKRDLEVVSGKDLITQIATWNPATEAFNPGATGIVLSRLCSADLPARSAFYDKRSKLGYDGPLFLNGEESTPEGRGFAHALDGTSYELASLGKFAWENSVANPATKQKTVVVGTDDSSPTGQVYVYVGDKKASGNPAERAGLTGGKLFGIAIPGQALEDAAAGVTSGSPFTAADLGDVSAKTGAQLETASDTALVTEWLRPEDAAWDPKHPNDLYFVTTATFGTKSRLYRLRFTDPANPAAGGTVDQLLEGTEDGGTGERYHMLDNIAIDRHGRVMLQEDPGGQDYLARIWAYDIAGDTLTEVAHHDPARFGAGAPGRLTNDEESSGIIDAEKLLGKGWFLIDAQAHYTHADPVLVEGGQLLALRVPLANDDEDGGDEDDD